jgi:hypothetical protein
MNGLQIQITMGIDYSKSNFDLISIGVEGLQDSLAQARCGVDELVSSYNGTNLMRTISVFKLTVSLLRWKPAEGLRLALANLKGRQDRL